MLNNMDDFTHYASLLLLEVERFLENTREIIVLDHAIAFLEETDHYEKYCESVDAYNRDHINEYAKHTSPSS